MTSTHRGIRRFLIVAAAALVVASVVQRRMGRGGGGDGLLPVIGGDTWPPVPVKESLPT